MNCYKYFVNVDNCIPEDIYGQFLYKSRSSMHNELLLLSPVSLGDNGSFSALHAEEIKTHLDRSTLKIDSFQIVIALQDEFPGSDSWDTSLLCRIFDIDQALIKAGVLDFRGNNPNCNLTIIRINRINENVDTTINDTKYITHRLKRDFIKLCNHLGIPTDKLISLKDTIAVLNNIKQQLSFDCQPYSESLSFFIQRVLNDINQQTLHITNENFEVDGFNETINTDNTFSLFQKVVDIVSRYDIYELFVDKNVRKQEIEATFRILDYLSYSFNDSNTEFRQQCKDYWQIVKNDKHLIEKYAVIMSKYRHKLNYFVSYGSNLIIENDPLPGFPVYSLPRADKIRGKKTWYNFDGNGESLLSSPNKTIDVFIAKLSPIAELKSRWLGTYDSLYKYTQNLQGQLIAYAESLKNDYTDILKRRAGRDFIEENSVYKVSPETESEIVALEERREKVILKIKDTMITPDLLFSDQNKILNQLSQANADITHYISCLENAKEKRLMWLLLAFILTVTTILYVFMQLEILTSPANLFALVYMLITVTGLSIAYTFVLLHYKNLIKTTLIDLKTNISKSIKAYETNARTLKSNINQCNVLDCIKHQIAIRKHSQEASHNRSRARAWYVERAKAHIERMDDFADIIGAYGVKPQQYDIKKDMDKYPIVADEGQIIDIVDCPLFWTDDA